MKKYAYQKEWLGERDKKKRERYGDRRGEERGCWHDLGKIQEKVRVREKIEL